MDKYEMRHQILDDILETLKEQGKFRDQPFDTKALLERSDNYAKDFNERFKAFRYLTSSDCIMHIHRGDENPSAIMTEKGYHLHNSEYFLEKHQEDFDRRKNNTITATSSIVVAIGVLWSIFQPTSNKQDIRIQVQKEGQSQTTIDTTVTFDKTNDSAILFYKGDTTKYK